MDANTLYKLMKPHLDLLTTSEKSSLLNLIGSEKPQRVTCHHRKIMSLNKAKEHLHKFCLREMERERKGQTAL